MLLIEQYVRFGLNWQTLYWDDLRYMNKCQIEEAYGVFERACARCAMYSADKAIVVLALEECEHGT